MTELLELKSISKIYGNGIYANRNVNFSVSEGEIHALVGENGAGKSTLMKVIYGLEQPDMGQIFIRGERVSFQSPQDAMRMSIGMVHQHFMLVESLTVAENVTLGFEPTKLGFIDAAQAQNQVAEIAKIFALDIDLSTRVSDLSVGLKQKVEIIKAMYRGAKILILDEPTAVLTPQETVDLFATLKDLKARGYTVIFISHKLREVMELCDRVSIMRKGEMVATMNIQDVTQHGISEMMVGASYSEKLDKTPAQPGKMLLRVRNVACVNRFHKRVVNGLSFSVRAGEILGIAGVEGNGQNELVEMIFNLRKGISGSIEAMGEDLSGRSIRALRDLGMSYIPADRLKLGLASTMSIEDNLLATKLTDRALYKGGFLSRTRIRAMSESLVQEYQIKCDSPATEIKMLSGGNMQKVVVAREFTQAARLFIVEQPSRGIDVGAAKFLHERLIALRDAGCAILLISADLDELFKLSDSIAVMYEGQIDAYFPDTTLVTENELGYYMLGVKRQSDEEIGGAYHAS
ncbi:MAG: ABC transporter ATP-binding protein [Clostridia bacterium]